ncbi:zinc ABC transporter substrate-binding protein ZnuA [Endozoicomonas sp. SCSIO W0465]|uniref:zinc ABC transporter substrate-binding protein ZnuA n=1 Tax=Endozoicomonas sp. SCSIO W0465 TaxID=2918516 RepID=UPI002075B909|nr:zinc ABC transporter substrate-binding protein ZnuA [Endozoicomonas sp. SCSIO W0465]USE36871.1 zinc ABC transporter substrate-binding protein ZnuA [Endozoicomonas sp. SCSIO W0465]
MQFVPVKQLLVTVWLITVSFFASAEPPRVLASIKPLQLIAQAVTEGVTEADVLLPPGSSPHSHSLKPSDARKLRSADIIFWVGPSMETFLPKMLASAKGGKAVSMMDIHGIRLRGSDEDGHHIHVHGEHHDHGDYDPHIWLSTDNARVIAREMTRVLVSVDKVNQPRYQSNLNRFLKSMDQTDSRNGQKVEQSGKKPFFVFHNAYGYLQEQYGLEVAGYFTMNPEQQPGARHLVRLKGHLDKAGATCIFREPQFQPAYIERLTEGLSVSVGVLDPLAENIQSGPESYAKFINQLVDSITSCTQG